MSSNNIFIIYNNNKTPFPLSSNQPFYKLLTFITNIEKGIYIKINKITLTKNSTKRNHDIDFSVKQYNHLLVEKFCFENGDILHIDGNTFTTNNVEKRKLAMKRYNEVLAKYGFD